MKHKPERMSTWWATFVEVGAILAYTGAIYAIAPALHGSLRAPWQIPIQVLLAVIPSVLWLIFFYRRDQREREPKRYVAGVFILAAALAQLVALPFVANAFAVHSWIYQTPWTLLAGSILIVGITQEFLKFIAVRYTVYGTVSFNEPQDGITYSTAAGLGFATILNINYIIENGGVDLRVGIIRIAVTALAHASFAGILGYFMGRAKFRPGSDIGPLLLGIATAAALNGAFHFAQAQATTRGLDYNAANGLLLATLLALIVFGWLFLLMARAQAATQSPLTAELGRYLREDLVLAGFVVVCVGLGALVRNQSLYETRVFPLVRQSVSVQLPATWISNTANTEVLSISNPYSGSNYQTQLAISHEKMPNSASTVGLHGVAAARSLMLAQELPLYRQVGTRAVEIRGRRGVESEYVHVNDPGRSSLLTVQLPVVVRARELLLPNGDELVVVRFAADNAIYKYEVKYLERALASLRLN
jgi:RsiW-degrading membrane proteinase PrsW (M82 family)